MQSKWYVELPIIIAIMVGATIFALNIDISAVPENTIEAYPYCGNNPTPVPNIPAGKDRWREGKSLFKSNCASCHNPTADGTGPPLNGVLARWKTAGRYKHKTGEQWLHIWIHNWHNVVDAKYPYAVSMAKSRKGEMNVFEYLTDKEIDDILFYVESNVVVYNSGVVY